MVATLGVLCEGIFLTAVLAAPCGHLVVLSSCSAGVVFPGAWWVVGGVPAQPRVCCRGKGVRTEEGQPRVLVCEGKAQCQEESCATSLCYTFL